jgi:hypothetical protein
MLNILISIILTLFMILPYSIIDPGVQLHSTGDNCKAIGDFNSTASYAYTTLSGTIKVNAVIISFFSLKN